MKRTKTKQKTADNEAAGSGTEDRSMSTNVPEGKPLVRHRSNDELDDVGYDSSSKRKIGRVRKSTSTKTAEVEQERMDLEGWSPAPPSAFKLLFSARLAAALWTSITDCDETYNYWEPTYYLLYGKGFQTWEYSPVYALRSYTYVLMHAVPAKFYEMMFHPSPLLLFILLRCFLAFLSTFTEYMLYKAVRKRFGGSVGRLALMASLFSAGMFISATAYLPSSFSGYMTALAIGSWLNDADELAIFCVALSTFLSWPFAALTGAFIAIDILLIRQRILLFIKWCVISVAIILVPIVAIDSSFYGKLVIAPLNIVKYNIFSSKGPDLYGTEPWTYYIINGFLNFNIMFVLTLCCPLILLVTYKTQTNFKEKLLVSSTALMWIVVFILQPHKEERFLYPIYPLIPVCGALAIEGCQKVLETINSNLLPRFGASARQLLEMKKRIVITLGIVSFLACSLLGSSRILALHYGYRAPFEVFFHLHRENLTAEPVFQQQNLTVCYGKEWHRFPTSFLLPNPSWNVRYIPSEFKGQLPGLFPPFDPEGTTVVPEHMNDDNLEEPTRYVNITDCDFLVDRVDPENVSEREPNYTASNQDWKVVTEYPFLNAHKSHPFFRAFYVPFLSSQYTHYDRYVFLINEKRKSQQNRESISKQKSRTSANEFLDDEL